MPAFRTGTVTEVISERRGLQRVDTTAGRAYVLTQLTGTVGAGDEVVVNTTAVELGLGTGGWHVVHWNLSRRALEQPGPGHIMKLRYTSLQADTGSVEELHGGALADADDVDGLPVVACGLHSQVACVAVALRDVLPRARIAYVMTDGAALPLAMSDLVVAMQDAGLLHTTITSGHAFGGEHEAVNLASALVAAKHVTGADVAIVAMGPGVVGTATKLGYSALEVGTILDTTAHVGGRPVACVRYSLADQRLRHQGVSHHTTTALRHTTARATIGVPAGEHEARVRADLDGQAHRLVTVPDPDVPSLLQQHGLRVTSMGRGPEDDPGFYAVAGAAGTVAATLMPT